jgi:hypothetical protein
MGISLTSPGHSHYTKSLQRCEWGKTAVVSVPFSGTIETHKTFDPSKLWAVPSAIASASPMTLMLIWFEWVNIPQFFAGYVSDHE